jgi:hypothetical protein
MDKVTGGRGQELTAPDHETHLTVSLWEHFELLPAGIWIPALWRAAALRAPLGVVRRVNWSYGRAPAPRCPSGDLRRRAPAQREGDAVLDVTSRRSDQRPTG